MLLSISYPAGHAALMGLCDRGGEVGEVAERMADGESNARTSIQVGIDVDGASEQVEFDFIAIFHQGNWTAHGGFRAAMHAHGPPETPETRVSESRATLP